MTDTIPTTWTGGQRAFGDFAPGLVHYTDAVLFDEVWARAALSKRDRSLITVAALIAGGDAEQLNFHLSFARDNGTTEQELIEAITHLAFYVGWPKAMSAMTVAKRVFAPSTEGSGPSSSTADRSSAPTTARTRAGTSRQ